MYSIHEKLCLRFKCYSSEEKGIRARMFTALEGKVPGCQKPGKTYSSVPVGDGVPTGM